MGDARARTRCVFTKPHLAAVFTCISGFNAHLSARVAFILKWFVIIESDKISGQAQKHVRGISVRIWAEISATRGESNAAQLLMYTIIAREQNARKTWRESACGAVARTALIGGAFICRGRTVVARILLPNTPQGVIYRVHYHAIMTDLWLNTNLSTYSK